MDIINQNSPIQTGDRVRLKREIDRLKRDKERSFVHWFDRLAFLS